MIKVHKLLWLLCASTGMFSTSKSPTSCTLAFVWQIWTLIEVGVCALVKSLRTLLKYYCCQRKIVPCLNDVYTLCLQEEGASWTARASDISPQECWGGGWPQDVGDTSATWTGWHQGIQPGTQVVETPRGAVNSHYLNHSNRPKHWKIGACPRNKCLLEWRYHTTNKMYRNIYIAQSIAFVTAILFCFKLLCIV